MSKKTIIIIIALIMLAILFYHYGYNRALNKRIKHTSLTSIKGDIRPISSPSKLEQKKTKFYSACIAQIDNDYRIGNNEIIQGFSETKTWSNDYGYITKVEISNKFYIAKGYFEKMRDSIKNIESFNNETVEIKNILIKAAETGIESIDLYTKGLYLKEQIGKVMIANMLASFQGGSPSPIPQYNGEVENGVDRIAVANSYVVDALKLLYQMLRNTFAGNVFSNIIASNITYYSPVSEADYDSYIKNGNYNLESKNYFESIIAYNKALKIRPKERDVLINLTKAYIENMDSGAALDTFNKFGEFYPNDKETISLKTDLKNNLLREAKFLNEAGYNKNALAILSEVEKFCPNDTEVAELKTGIEQKQ